MPASSGLEITKRKNKRHHDQKGEGAVGQKALPPTEVLDQLRTDAGMTTPDSDTPAAAMLRAVPRRLSNQFATSLLVAGTHIASAKAIEQTEHQIKLPVFAQRRDSGTYGHKNRANTHHVTQMEFVQGTAYVGRQWRQQHW